MFYNQMQEYIWTQRQNIKTTATQNLSTAFTFYLNFKVDSNLFVVFSFTVIFCNIYIFFLSPVK